MSQRMTLLLASHDDFLEYELGRRSDDLSLISYTEILAVRNVNLLASVHNSSRGPDEALECLSLQLLNQNGRVSTTFLPVSSVAATTRIAEVISLEANEVELVMVR